MYPFMNLYGEQRGRVAWLKALTENDIIHVSNSPIFAKQKQHNGKGESYSKSEFEGFFVALPSTE